MPYCDDINNPQCPIALGIFDTGATTFSFTGTRPDLEQAAYVQDLIRLGNWTDQRGPAMGPLPIAGEPKRSGTADRRLALLS